ncbi:MAG: EAL domain-containing protein [Ruminococcaceae bacterium]|nr:EAL domain-containing protein [Oscillospiraceae bacterium]
MGRTPKGGCTMGTSVFDLLPVSGTPMEILGCLDRSDYDELVEIDLVNDRCTNLYHVEGKYFVPLVDGSTSGIFQYSMEHMIHPDDRQHVREAMDPDTVLERLASSEPPGIMALHFRYKLLDGGWRWVEQIVVGGTQFGFGEGVVHAYIFDFQNQKDRQLGLMSAYPRKGNRDEMTGLPGKKTFFAKGGELVRTQKADWALLAIDVEHFKLFNQWYGHESGDLLLAMIGGVLKDEEKSGGIAVYMGQDDFCLLTPYDRARFEALFEKLHQLVVSRGASVGFLPAIGISRVEADGSVMSALDRAAIAVSHIKGNFRTRILEYDQSMQDQTDMEYRLLEDFQRAIRNHELFFCLQPQCTVPEGTVVGAESLARWKTPEGKMVPPDRFVPVLEKYGFVTDLDQYIWEGVCAWLHRWIQDGHTPVPVSINVSRVDFFTIDVPEFLDRLMKKYELPRSVLKIEVTESAYVDDGLSIRDAVQRLREMGFLVLMDDFGSGYSSLNMLRSLNMDVIKLDAQFLRMGELDMKKGVNILETIVNMTKTMAVPIIVEGVESREQVVFLEKLGCRYIQGNYYHLPLPVSDFEKLIGDEKNIDTGGFSFHAQQQFTVREFMDQNIYSDTMLNNILGAAAFYCWDGKERVDIVRFNEQFRRLVNVPDFTERLTDIRQFFHPNDKQPFLDLLAAAEKDRLNGAEGVFGVYRTDGTLGRFFEHFFFLEENDGGKIFYGAIQEVTEITRLQNQMRLLSTFSSESIAFLSFKESSWQYQVIAHGLRDDLGMSRTEFERALNDGMLLDWLDEEGRQLLDELGSGVREKIPRISLRVDGGKGAPVDIDLKIDYVHDEYSDVEYLMMFRLHGD